MKKMRLLRHPFVSSCFAAILVTVAAAFRVGPLQPLGTDSPWLTFYPAVTAAAIFGGLSAGLIATVLACLGVTFFWPLFSDEPFINTHADWLGMFVFIVTGSIVSVVCGAIRRIQDRAETYQTLVKSMDEGFCVVEVLYDSDGNAVDYRFIECNPAFQLQTGLDQAEGKTMRSLVPDHEDHWFQTCGRVAQTGESVRFENVAAAMQKHYDVFAFRIGGFGSNRVGILFKDVTRRKKTEQELVDSALHDSLTGLPNRAMCLEHLGKAVARAERGNHKVALLFLDLDGFKAVNDTLGHLAGDRLLKAVAERLTSNGRAGNLVCRFGGDEFMIILENCRPEMVPSVASRFIRVLEMPIQLDEQVVQISASVGYAIYPESASDVDTLIQVADAVMYSAKGNRKAGIDPVTPVAEDMLADFQMAAKVSHHDSP